MDTNQRVVLSYVGQGRHINGVPARDLTRADLTRQERRGRSADYLVESGIYRPARKPAAPKAAETTAEGGQPEEATPESAGESPEPGSPEAVEPEAKQENPDG